MAVLYTRSMVPNMIEIKHDDSFLPWHFHIDGFDIQIRLDCNKNGGGIRLFTCDDIPVIPLSSETASLEGYMSR